MAGFLPILGALCALLLLAAGPVRAQQNDDGLPLPLPGVADNQGGPAATASQADIARLGDALEQMKVQNPVVARVNGHEIRWAAVMASADGLPERYRDQLESVFPALLDRLVDVRLLAEAARAQGLAEDAEVRERLVGLEDRVLSTVFLERYLAEQVTTAAVRERYDALVALRRANREVRARHIIVETEEEAEAIIAELDGGAVFPTLARERSIGPSAERGGDLGYFFARRMAPAFAEALHKLEPGSYSAEPVETEFGWHVILLVERRADDVPSFLDMQTQLREELTRESMSRMVGNLRQRASLEMFPEDTAGSEGAAPGTDAGADGQ
ncbi:peptidylprolyl isomerase [Pelagibius litoralis]|uniref:Parvulin-like PPIase n=1 Tax=Pelagibius litoralis TaxID=374515 RepID=A0A967F2F7_9PROT|nr:peptidylprolyl isomerase [Pelagibius litoralis]NIA71855.1 peptidylprolyl isomerase [Pelagibius litoralis]